MVFTKVASLKEGEGSYRRGQFNRGKMHCCPEKGKWSFYRGG